MSTKLAVLVHRWAKKYLHMVQKPKLLNIKTNERHIKNINCTAIPSLCLLLAINL